MRHLIIYAHPNPNSLNHHFKQHLREHLEENGHETIVRDLYKLGFNPVLSLDDLAGQRQADTADDVKKEQEHIMWAECITLIHPIWWTGLPAILKGYIDRVFSYGFAYSYHQGVQQALLVGKQVVIINTHGKSNTMYRQIGMDKALSLTSDTGIYSYCGLKIKYHFFFDKADKVNADIVEKWTRQIKEVF